VAAVVTRGPGIEALHTASVAVLDASGKLSYFFGDAQFRTFARSSIKPLQALPLVLTGAADALGLSHEHLAITCASHSGSDDHVRVVEDLLARAGATAHDLQCGAHLPIGMRLQGLAALGGEDRDPLRNACSGKHAGFLALARHLGEPFSSYLAPEGRVQRLVRQAVARACRADPESLEFGIDGCSAPNYALPLSGLAFGFGSLLKPEWAEPELRPALERVAAAMRRHPKLVSGEGRFDHQLSQNITAHVLAKVGAEALELMVSSDPFWAMAVKIHDGAERALAPVCLAVLQQLGVFADKPLTEDLADQIRPAVRNHRKLLTGEIVATLRLELADLTA
jgi:L-asparaginase II